MGIQRLKTLEGGHRYQEVAPHVTHHPLHLHLTLVIALARTHKLILEQVVGLQLGESPGALALTASQDPGQRQPGIVVQDALWNSPQKCQGRDAAVQEGLGGLRRIGLHKTAVAVGQSRTK